MKPGAGTDRAESPVRPGVAPRRGEVSAGWLAFLLNVPTLAGLALVLAYPICFAGYLSFHEVSIRHLRAGEFPFAGLANFSRLFQDDVFWLSLRHTAVFVAYVWRTTPFNILLYHAAIQGIPAQIYEAAAVDGASSWQSLWRLTLPLLRPVIAVTLILRTTFSFMVFDEILAITQGGPGNDTWVAAWYTYRMAFQPPFNIGLGAASAWVLAMIVGMAAIAYVKLVYRRVDYA